ncbi:MULTISPECIES: Acg family FMN-binding oxidoreductase [Nocardiaceae]|uniref:Acg family FMN-binding oxidoreductase n=1 Tax=Nocardiaceae TaxID=85025 RepID=UPI00068A0A2B|nr:MULTISPECIES: hypothetical protein [Rhodococcus]OZF00766.1 hypothetical protein CH301_11995 [Rhodococcus sp. 15-1189-1-1a]OZF21179.1 hypothetical protein CH299_02890 [Rhodococcus sp. 14-2686-1-2]
MFSHPDSSVVQMMVELACRAPSVHNSQPWKWSYRDGYLDLHTDRSRLLDTIDPTGRQLVISCGAALDHLRKAAVTFRWSADVLELPIPGRPDHLARIRFVHGAHPQSHEFDLLSAINRRHSDRRPFTRASDSLVIGAAARADASQRGTTVSVLTPQSRRTLAEASMSSAGVRRYDATYQAELRWWAGHSFAGTGIPDRALADRSETTNVAVGRSFPAPHDVRNRAPGADVLDESTVVLLSTPTDHLLDWMHCGQVLSSILLEATVGGLATCPLTHMTEQSGSRALVESLAPDSGVPQVLVRLGAAPAGHAPRPTPRLQLSAILTTENAYPSGRDRPASR